MTLKEINKRFRSRAVTPGTFFSQILHTPRLSNSSAVEKKQRVANTDPTQITQVWVSFSSISPQPHIQLWHNFAGVLTQLWHFFPEKLPHAAWYISLQCEQTIDLSPWQISIDRWWRAPDIAVRHSFFSRIAEFWGYSSQNERQLEVQLRSIISIKLLTVKKGVSR